LNSLVNYWEKTRRGWKLQVKSLEKDLNSELEEKLLKVFDHVKRVNTTRTLKNVLELKFNGRKSMG
jgi:hypothetical protein